MSIAWREMAAFKGEELILTVRNFPVLYDQTHEEYRNTDYKDMIWKVVAKELNVEGQEEECKKRWNGIRDSLRRARQKRKSGHAVTPTYKYKYESILAFLIPHLADRKGSSNIADDEDVADDPLQQNSSKETQNENDSQDATESASLRTPETPEVLLSINRSRPLFANRKRKLEAKPQETSSSQRMPYISAKRKKESGRDDVPHHVDAFLSGIATTLKTLHPLRLHSAKGKIFEIVQEYELQQILDNSNQQTEMMHTGNASDATSFTVSEEEGSYADYNGAVTHFLGFQHTSASPAFNEDT